MSGLNYCGTTLSVVVAAPATIDVAGFAALSWTANVGGLVDIDPIGDTSQAIQIPYLNGRTGYVGGAVEGGEINGTYAWLTSDAGQVILRANANGNTTISWRVTDPDGRVAYGSGLVGPVRDVGRNSGAYKGQTFVLRVNTATIHN